MHGNQEGRFYHGYYGHYCYLPLYCFCGNIPLLAQLRTSGIDACEGTVEALEKIVPAIRKRFGRGVQIVLRGDSGFARESIMHWCEPNKVMYCLGLARNQRLQEQLDKETTKRTSPKASVCPDPKDYPQNTRTASLRSAPR